LGNEQKEERSVVRSRYLEPLEMIGNATGNGTSVRGSTTVEANGKRRDRKERNSWEDTLGLSCRVTYTLSES